MVCESGWLIQNPMTGNGILGVPLPDNVFVLLLELWNQ